MLMLSGCGEKPEAQVEEPTEEVIYHKEISADIMQGAADDLQSTVIPDEDVVLLKDASGNEVTSSTISQVGIPTNLTNEQIDDFVENAEAMGLEIDDPDDDRIIYVSEDQVHNEHFGVLKFGKNSFTTPMNYTVREYSDGTSQYQSCFYNDNFNYVACATVSLNEVEKFDAMNDTVFDALCTSLFTNGFSNVEIEGCENTSTQGNYKSLTCVVYGTGYVVHREKNINCHVTAYFNAPRESNVVYEMAIVEPIDSEFELNQEDKEKFIEKFKSIDGL